MTCSRIILQTRSVTGDYFSCKNSLKRSCVASCKKKLPHVTSPLVASVNQFEIMSSIQVTFYTFIVTTFSSLLRIWIQKQCQLNTQKKLRIITYIGCSLSFFGLTFTLFTMFIFKYVITEKNCLGDSHRRCYCH